MKLWERARLITKLFIVLIPLSAREVACSCRSSRIHRSKACNKFKDKSKKNNFYLFWINNLFFKNIFKFYFLPSKKYTCQHPHLQRCNSSFHKQLRPPCRFWLAWRRLLAYSTSKQTFAKHLRMFKNCWNLKITIIPRIMSGTIISALTCAAANKPKRRILSIPKCVFRRPK